jgi:hypothetical protein
MKPGRKKTNRFSDQGEESLPKGAFSTLKTKLRELDNGRIPVPGLGIFIVRTVTKEVEGKPATKKTIRLRLKERSSPGSSAAG